MSVTVVVDIGILTKKAVTRRSNVTNSQLLTLRHRHITIQSTPLSKPHPSSLSLRSNPSVTCLRSGVEQQPVLLWPHWSLLWSPTKHRGNKPLDPVLNTSSQRKGPFAMCLHLAMDGSINHAVQLWLPLPLRDLKMPEPAFKVGGTNDQGVFTLAVCFLH